MVSRSVAEASRVRSNSILKLSARLRASSKDAVLIEKPA